MPSFDVTFHLTSELKTIKIDADNRDEAIAQAIAQAPEGSQPKIMTCVESVADPEVDPPTKHAAATTHKKEEPHHPAKK